MKWRRLHTLLTSLAGKALLIVSIAPPMAALVGYGFTISTYRTTIVGALLILGANLAASIAAPPLVVTFPHGNAYAGYLLTRLKKSTVDVVSEFAILNDNRAQLPRGQDSFGVAHLQFESIQASLEQLGEPKALRALALLKYDFTDQSSPCVRWTITCSLVLGILLTYFSTIRSIAAILDSGS